MISIATLNGILTNNHNTAKSNTDTKKCMVLPYIHTVNYRLSAQDSNKRPCSNKHPGWEIISHKRPGPTKRPGLKKRPVRISTQVLIRY